MSKRFMFRLLNLNLNIVKPICLFNVCYKSTTMKILNVAEKNDAAKNIALHLSRGTSNRREGFSQYNKIYEFEALVFNEMSQMIMTSVSGHLLELKFVDAYKSWQSCNPLLLFDAPVYKHCPENYQNIKKTLEREVRSCKKLIIWTDCDREGENIGFEIIKVCKDVNRNLEVYRAKFSEITAVSVKRALQNLAQPNKNISDAVDVRQELDLRIGAAFTRFQTLRLQRVFPNKLSNSLVSYGSCQFPTLGFVVERYRAVESFIAEPFWKIKVNHTMNNLSVDFNWERIRLFDRDACAVLHDACTEEALATVSDVKTKPKSKWRPLPLDTVELEKLASRKLKINAKETMKIAEKLYTQGLISYPRTETNEYPKEMNLGQLVGLHTGDPNWGAFAQRIMDEGGPNPRQGNKSDKAHPPIHPTKHSSSLTGNEHKLYEFIVRSFLACCYKDAQGQETTVSIDVADEKFSASGLMILARNYLDVYPYDKWTAKEIHVYESGQTFTPTSIDMVDGETSPPNLLTEADLIALMEKHGIGTDATHADHIETIKSRSYVALADAIHFVPGVLGMGLVEGYDAMGLGLARPVLRAQLEAALVAVSEGRRDPNTVLAEQVAIYREVYETVMAEANKIDAALAERFHEPAVQYTDASSTAPAQMRSVLKCPKCSMDMVVRQKRNSDEYFIGCLSYPSCKNAVWLPNVRTIEVLNDTCQECGPNYRKLKLQWRNNSVSHLYPPPCIVCVGGCDLTFLDVMQIHLSSVKSMPESNNNPIWSNDRSQNSVAARPTQLLPRSTQTVIRPTQTGPRPTQTGPRPSQTGPRPTQTIPRSNSAQPLPIPRAPTGSRQASQSANNIPGTDNEVMCYCNQQAILLTVRKQNDNFGKKFYKCVKGRENGGCDFFAWSPENDSEPTRDRQVGGEGPSGGWGVASRPPPQSGQGNVDGVDCNCGMAAKKLTVHKEGPNKGREFYSCSKDYSSRCDFFQWADSPSVDWAPQRGRSTRGRGRGRGEGGRGRGDGVRRCTRCRQEGHNRNRCPERET